MLFCKRFLEHMYIGFNYNVTTCGWNDYVLGNLLEETVEAIWLGEKRKNLLKQLREEGELAFCRREHCPHCLNDEITEISPEEFDELVEKSTRPVDFNFAFDLRCNHKCPSCRQEYYVPPKGYRDDMKILVDKLKPYLPDAKRVAMSGSGDIFVNPEMLGALEQLHPVSDEFHLKIETNGVLFKDNWHKIQHLLPYLATLTVTVNSFHRRTYAYLEGKDDLDILEENLAFIRDLKKEEEAKFVFRNTMVVQDSNFREIPEFIDRALNVYHADVVILRPIFKWFHTNEIEWWYKNVQNPAHIYHEEFLEIMKEPICSDPRVRHWGTQDLLERVELPYERESRRLSGYYNILSALEMIPDIKQKLYDFLQDEGLNKFAIYGGGKVGKILSTYLPEEKLCTFIDTHGSGCDSEHVLTPSAVTTYKDKIDAVFVTPVFEYDKIKDTLTGAGYSGEIINVEEMLHKWM